MVHEAQPNDPPTPPICAPIVPEKVIGPVTPKEDVATAYTPAPPFDTSRLLDEKLDVVASPVHVTVELVPPTNAPRAEYPVKGPEKLIDVVEIALRFIGVPFVLVAKGICPAVNADDEANGLEPLAGTVIVIGELPIVVNPVQEAIPEQVTVVVATPPTTVGDVPVKYASCGMAMLEVVPIVLAPDDVIVMGLAPIAVNVEQEVFPEQVTDVVAIPFRLDAPHHAT